MRTGFVEVQPTEALPGIAPPGAVLHLLGHWFAELTVAGNVDAEIALMAHDLGNRIAEGDLKRRFVDRMAGFMVAVGGDQPVRARQTADVTGEDMILTGSHV